MDDYFTGSLLTYNEAGKSTGTRSVVSARSAKLPASQPTPLCGCYDADCRYLGRIGGPIDFDAYTTLVGAVIEDGEIVGWEDAPSVGDIIETDVSVERKWWQFWLPRWRMERRELKITDVSGSAVTTDGILPFGWKRATLKRRPTPSPDAVTPKDTGVR